MRKFSCSCNVPTLNIAVEMIICGYPITIYMHINQQSSFQNFQQLVKLESNEDKQWKGGMSHFCNFWLKKYQAMQFCLSDHIEMANEIITILKLGTKINHSTFSFKYIHHPHVPHFHYNFSRLAWFPPFHLPRIVKKIRIKTRRQRWWWSSNIFVQCSFVSQNHPSASSHPERI